MKHIAIKRKLFGNKKRTRIMAAVLAPLCVAMAAMMIILPLQPTLALPGDQYTATQYTLPNNPMDGNINPYTLDFGKDVGSKSVGYHVRFAAGDIGMWNDSTMYYLDDPGKIADSSANNASSSYVQTGPNRTEQLYNGNRSALRWILFHGYNPRHYLNFGEYYKKFLKGESNNNTNFYGYTIPSIKYPSSYPDANNANSALVTAIDNLTPTEAAAVTQAAIWHFSQGWELTGAAATGLNYSRLKIVYDALVYSARNHAPYSLDLPFLVVSITPSATGAISMSQSGGYYYYGPINVKEFVQSNNPTNQLNFGNIYLELNDDKEGKLSFASKSGSAYTDLPTGPKYDMGTNAQYTANNTDIYVKIDDPDPQPLLDGVTVTATGAVAQNQTNSNTFLEPNIFMRQGYPNLFGFTCSCMVDVFGVETFGLGNMAFWGTKTADDTFGNRNFTFSVYKITQAEFDAANGVFEKTNKVSTGTLKGTGDPRRIVFTPIAYTDADANQTYHYAIVEDTPPAGWNANTQVFYRTVSVKKTGGLLWSKIELDDNAPYKNAIAFENTVEPPSGGSAKFTNEYEQPKATVNLVATKNSEGGMMNAGQFNFELYSSNANGDEVSLLQTKSNSADGSTSPVEFDEMAYDTTGESYYLMKELPAAEEGWQEDPKQYHIKVSVTGTAALTAKVEFRSRDGSEGEWSAWTQDEEADIAFTNLFIPPGGLSFYKTGKDGNGDVVPLEGVEFRLYKCTQPAHLEPADHSTLADGRENCCWDIDNPFKNEFSDSDGFVAFPNLPLGTYMLAEIKTNPGYQLPMGQWLISIEAGGSIAIEARGIPPAFMEEDGKYYLRNHRQIILPRSGGATALLSSVIGMLIFCTAVTMWLLNMRKYKRRKKILSD